MRRVLLTGRCAIDVKPRVDAQRDDLASLIERAEVSVGELTARYCDLLYARKQSYVDVARITGLDRRTVKKLVQQVSTRG